MTVRLGHPANGTNVLTQKQAGLSLLEMLVSLAIFSVIVFPMVLVPNIALEKTEIAKDSNIANFETEHFLDTFRREVNSAYRFLHFKPIADNVPLDMSVSKQVFLAYWDSRQQREVRVGYALREIFSDPPTNSASYSPKRFQILRVEIPAGATISNYQLDSSTWKPVGQVAGHTDFYITADYYSTSEKSLVEPIFVYCKGSVCDNSVVSPQEADGVRLQSDSTVSAPRGVHITYRKSQSYMNAMYFRLASMQGEINRNQARHQMLPFSIALDRWDKSNSWIVEKVQSDVGFGAYRVPVENVSEVSSGTALPINDFHYNIRTGELLAATNSGNTTSSQPDSALYIFKFKPGFPDYKPYALSVATGGSYADYFPVAIHQGEPAWPPVTSQVDCISVTQDLDNNIYVLLRTGTSSYEFWIEKFSPQGNYISRFNLGSDLDDADPSAVSGITYNPATPYEIIALVKKTSGGDYRLRAYLKDQNEDDGERVIVSAESENLNVSSITPAGFSWANVKGLEYDPINHRYFFVFGTTSTDIKVLGLDVDIRTVPIIGDDDGTPAERAATVTRIYPPDDDTPLQGPTGIAFNPLNNLLYVSTNEGGLYRYYPVIPEHRLTTIRTAGL